MQQEMSESGRNKKTGKTRISGTTRTFAPKSGKPGHDIDPDLTSGMTRTCGLSSGKPGVTRMPSTSDASDTSDTRHSSRCHLADVGPQSHDRLCGHPTNVYKGDNCCSTALLSCLHFLSS
jgi:hypothetical protein